MKERPILFSAPMVRAILEGKKTQTRRVVKGADYFAAGWPCKFGKECSDRNCLYSHVDGRHLTVMHLPYGKTGDRLWVREAWRTYSSLDGCKPSNIIHGAGIQYEAAGTNIHNDNGDYLLGMGKLRPSIFMPRWSSRILLEITDVRVERLQNISEKHAIEEGLSTITKDGGRTVKYGIPDADGYPGNDDIGWNWEDWNISPISAYRRLWESINGQGSWDTNPWVWVIEFKMATK